MAAPRTGFQSFNCRWRYTTVARVTRRTVSLRDDMSSQSRNAKGAGRPIQYDRAAAIDAATKLFFEKGFRDTSIQDVVSVTGMATGMQTGSVYAAFGSKLALFLECLDTELSALDRRLEPLRELGSDPLQSLMAFWRVGQATFDRPSFAARALVDFTDRDSEVWQRVSAAWAERDRVIEDILRRAQDAGHVAPWSTVLSTLSLRARMLHGCAQ